MSISSQSSNQRLFAIDTLKAMSIAAVVSYHSIFVPEATYASVAQKVEILFAPLRFCVPVFLTIFFFLLARGLEHRAQEPLIPFLQKRLIRLLIPTLFWFTLAASFRLISHVNSLSEVLVALVQGIIFPGAYYLLILFQLIIIFSFIFRWFYRLPFVILVIAGQALIFGAVYLTLSGVLGEQPLAVLHALARPFIIYWLGYMALGALLFKHWNTTVQISAKIPTAIKWAFVICISLGMVCEYQYIYSATAGQPRPFEYSMYSCMLSALVYFFCFASVRAKYSLKIIQNLIFYLSKYSLGIFCLNGILSLILFKIGSTIAAAMTFNLPEVILLKLVGWIFLLALSLGISIGLDRIGLSSCVR